MGNNIQAAWLEKKVESSKNRSSDFRINANNAIFNP